MLISIISKGIIKKIDFKLINIKDENGELIRIKIPRKILFEIENNIRKRLIFNNDNNNRYINSYIYKSLLYEDLTVNGSISRLIYILNVFHYSIDSNYEKINLFIQNRYFNNEIIIYAKSLFQNVTVNINEKILFNPFKYFIKKLKENVRIRIFIHNIKFWKTKTYKSEANLGKILFFGRGDLINNQDKNYSDLFWFNNSIFNKNQIIFESFNKNQIHSSNKIGIESNLYRVNYEKADFPKYEYSINRKLTQNEKYRIKELYKEYNANKRFWHSYFKSNSTLIYLTWYKYCPTHIVKTEALKALGGVTAIWQLAFDGYTNYESRINTDIIFSFSNWSAKLEKLLGSKINYNIITGYCKDHVINENSKLTSIYRNRILDSGVDKIICVFDENSHDDERWHTGHAIQKDNYLKVLEVVLDQDWLGVVFKPKNIKSLKHRIGDAWDLLNEAINKGKCILFEDSGFETTSASAALASSIADISIHGHLCSGTAALESALSGKRTIMIDREGTPETKYNILPKGEIVFDNWEDSLNATIDFLKGVDGSENVGNWSKYINQFDPFRDGKASNRIGEYLNWLYNDLKSGIEREKALEISSEKYAQKWGEQYIIKC